MLSSSSSYSSTSSSSSIITSFDRKHDDKDNVDVGSDDDRKDDNIDDVFGNRNIRSRHMLTSSRA